MAHPSDTILDHMITSLTAQAATLHDQWEAVETWLRAITALRQHNDALQETILAYEEEEDEQSLA